MDIFITTFGALGVACIYVCWERHRRYVISRSRVIRERVAFMLWQAALRAGSRVEQEAELV